MNTELPSAPNLTMYIFPNSTSNASGRPCRLVGAGVLALLFFGLVGCGPVQSTSRISDAKVASARARVAEAHKKAPFEYYSAQSYLHKADRKSTRLNSSHVRISYAVFCLKKKKNNR